ncbi:MAG TPA: TetR family transcriptional regulator [Candidatus Limnocylindrales bacterium]|nr:TetR family transcriptional regulator [Candidatus Limnocylindrales bacterium]
MRSASDPRDLTARATIRNAALRLFADHGPDAVTVREIALQAGVSPALVLHHFGSKDGLRAEVDAVAAQAFDAIFEGMPTEDIVELLAGGATAGSLAEAFARGFPPGSPLPAYLGRLFLTHDPAGAALFGRWYAMTRRLLDTMADAGVARPTHDPAVRAAFFLVNDLGLILLRTQIAMAIGVDPLTPEGIDRWAREASAVYAEGAFRAPTED